MCRSGKHTPYGKCLIKQAVHSWRQEVRIKLKMGDYDNIPEYKAVGYTD